MTIEEVLHKPSEKYQMQETILQYLRELSHTYEDEYGISEIIDGIASFVDSL